MAFPLGAAWGCGDLVVGLPWWGRTGDASVRPVGASALDGRRYDHSCGVSLFGVWTMAGAADPALAGGAICICANGKVEPIM